MNQICSHHQFLHDIYVEWKKKKKKNFNEYLYLEFLPKNKGFPLTDE